MRDETKKLTPAWPPKVHRTAPRPGGLLSGRRYMLRRWAAIGLSATGRVMDHLPPGRWLHRLVRRGLRFTDVQVPLRRGDSALDGLRAIFLSDIHAGGFLDKRDLRQIFGQVAQQEPDLVLLGGDLINTREREILMFREALQLISPPLGIFAVPGNHDHFWGKDLGLWSPFLRELGVTVLNNRGARITRGGAGLWLAGVDDLTEGEPDLAAALVGSHPDEPVILLSHHPDFFFESAAVGVDLTLAGHTHGGQIAPLGKALIVHSRFGYLAGMYEEEGAQLYVSRGVGLTLLPIRIGAPAEAPILTLRTTSS